MYVIEDSNLVTKSAQENDEKHQCWTYIHWVLPPVPRSKPFNAEIMVANEKFFINEDRKTSLKLS